MTKQKPSQTKEKTMSQNDAPNKSDDDLRKKISLHTEAVFNLSIALANGVTHQQATDALLNLFQVELEARERKAEQRGVTWSGGVVDDLHTHHVDTMQMTSEADRFYKGVKNTLRDRYKNLTGVDPAPSYPAKAQLHKDSQEDTHEPLSN